MPVERHSQYRIRLIPAAGSAYLITLWAVRPGKRLRAQLCIFFIRREAVSTIPISTGNAVRELSPAADKELGLCAGRLPGRRVWSRSSFGERVPFRRIGLASAPEAFGGGRQPAMYLYDVSGPLGEDADGASDNASSADGWGAGLPRRRSRPVPGSPTQLESARAGIVTPEMAFAAERENLMRAEFRESLKTLGSPRAEALYESAANAPLWTPEDVRDLIAQRKAVIPLSFRHPEAEPMIIGRAFTTKVNANIGASGACRVPSDELGKLREALLCGADTVMDLSTGENIASIRESIIRHSPVPVGTVPIYEALERAGKPEKITWEIFRDVMEEQAAQGVDYMTIHAGLLRSHAELTKHRLTGIVSRGGGILALWMKLSGKENFLYEHFDDILRIARRFDITLSLGDGLRPGCLHDGSDPAQLAELRTLGELFRRAGDFGVQVMIEGPGHIALSSIRLNQELEELWCSGAPFYTLGPLVTDIGAGYDHITAAIGGAVIGAAGTAMLCYVTPKEHLGLPDARDVRAGMAAFRIAAHAADIARGVPGAELRDLAMSAARFEFRWNDQFLLSVDPARAAALHDEALPGTGSRTAHFCSLCGPAFCPMKIARDLFG